MRRHRFLLGRLAYSLAVDWATWAWQVLDAVRYQLGDKRVGDDHE